jgi:hypothetical protein
MLKFMSNMDQTVTPLNLKADSQNQIMNSHSQSIAKLEVQMRQMANTLNHMEAGELPSQLVASLKGNYMVEASTSNHQQMLAINTLGGGRMVDNHVQEKVNEQTEIPQNLQKDTGKQVNTKASSPSAPTPEILNEPWVPFPKRLKEPSHFGKQGKKIQDMVEVFKQVKVNIPLLDAIKQVPAYAKFHKDLCTQKKEKQKSYSQESPY